MIKYDSLKEIIELAENKNVSISDIVLEDQIKELDISKEKLIKRMKDTYSSMIDSVVQGMEDKKSNSGLSGFDAKKMDRNLISNFVPGSELIFDITKRAIAVGEKNAFMGKIVACPTAGASGIIPGVFISVQEKMNLDNIDMVKILFTTGAIGMVISNLSSVSGAKGGCKAECGSAAAMAAGALVELMGGNPKMVGNAVALVLKSTMGLVCDPIAGLVEVPCIKRNGNISAMVISSANMALSNIESIIPVDEVIIAMKNVGDMMDSRLKETSLGGLANTKTRKKLTKDIFGEINGF